MIVDAQGRRFRNLRVSLTAACNYACTYCVPDGKRLLAAQYELDSDEMALAIDLLIEAAGIRQVRLTGGEPLLSPKFDTLLPAIMRLPLADVSLTTNGQLLLRKADVICASGVRRINVSLDTLDREAFRRIARGGDLDTVLAGIEAMLDAGIRVKINMVPLRGRNSDQILPLLAWCLARGVELRFIELMKMGHLRAGNQFVQQFFGMEDILATIGERYEYARTDAPWDATAVRFKVPGEGAFGIIANESAPFCATCTRLRLSSNGRLYGCLSNSRWQDLRPALGLERAQALARTRQLLTRALGDKQDHGFSGEVTVMKFIGG